MFLSFPTDPTTTISYRLALPCLSKLMPAAIHSLTCSSPSASLYSILLCAPTVLRLIIPISLSLSYHPLLVGQHTLLQQSCTISHPQKHTHTHIHILSNAFLFNSIPKFYIHSDAEKERERESAYTASSAVSTTDIPTSLILRPSLRTLHSLYLSFAHQPISQLDIT